MNPEAVSQLKRDLEAWLEDAFNIASSILDAEPTRENAMVKTKVEEAQMWFAKATT